MRLNENTVLITEKLYLVPYKKEHVLRYHEWMKDPYLQMMTASEPLSLEEEYEMQNSWHIDEEKCTFILLQREKNYIVIEKEQTKKENENNGIKGEEVTSQDKNLDNITDFSSILLSDKIVLTKSIVFWVISASILESSSSCL